MTSRGLISTLTAAALLSLLATCSLETGFRPASGAELPADQVLDVARSFSGPFEYETLLPVALNLTVQLYQQPSPAAALTRQATGSQLIVVSLRNSRGETLYSGAVSSGGTLATVLSLPAAPQDVVLRLDAPGYEPREVTIDGMVQYSEINRVMGLLSDGLAAKGDLPDTDLDGVPDIYDADPLDPEVAFQVRTPASGQFTVAFEDLYPVPGDADYNDFVAKYFILENHRSEVAKEDVLEMVEEPNPKPIEVMLHNLYGEATATAKVAGYSHKFGIVIDFPGVTASRVTRQYYDAYGSLQTGTQDNVAGQAVVWLFENTSKGVAGKTASFEIIFPKGTTRNMVSIAPYDPVLYVLNTKQEIHMVGQDPLSSPVSAQAAELSYLDPNGYPWALLVPEEWQHPAETQYIGKAYPLFDEWRASKGAVAPYWYLYPASTGSEPGNSPPSKVSSTDSTQLAAGSNLTQYFQLKSVDPDGDSVEFLSSPAPKALQDLFSLDAVKGLASFKPGVPEGDYLFYFWSVDGHGASNITDPLKLTFTFQKKSSDNLPPTASFPPTGYWVDGAGTAAVDGYYTPGEVFYMYPRYLQTGGSYILFEFWAGDQLRHWQLNTVLPPLPAAPPFPALDTIPYYGPTPADSTPTEGLWFAGAGLDPVPTVLRVPISGNPRVGNLLTGHYLFFDPDAGDTDASTFQWYRFANGTDTTGGTAIPGATSNYYQTVSPTDTNQWLRIQVTPVDSRGAAGTPILSDPLKVIPLTS